MTRSLLLFLGALLIGYLVYKTTGILFIPLLFIFPLFWRRKK